MEKTIEIPEGYEARIEGNKVILELKESEDETIRKELIGFIQDEIDSINRLVSGDYDDRDADDIAHQKWCEKALAWLKKQGEQKEHNICDTCENKYGCISPCPVKLIGQNLSDKVEPKFKVGDWVVCCDYEPEQIIGIRTNVYEMSNGDIRPFCMTDDNYNVRPWTIQDAKDGDVLVASDGSIFLFKSDVDGACKHYVALTTDNVVKFNEGLEHYWETSRAVHPATKEQRDLLFQKMKDAGYEWDAEKKEPKKIVQNPTWSEEDERVKQDIENLIHFALRDGSAVSPGADTTKEGALGWLKSLKERYTWKPSDEQITQLSKYCPDNRPLTSLYNDLKKLKG